MKLFNTLKKVRGIKSEVQTLARAYMDKRTPTETKFLIAVIALVYIVSPVDFAPDIIPFLGLADDTMIIPLLMWIFIPNNILDDARNYYGAIEAKKPKHHHWLAWSLLAGFGIILIVVLVQLIR